ncbi:hypothetical protein P5673_014129 [Acropora cervicornis]|uniref:Uncharacterized protein n=1 Tax=Acropora cervicornis TaxID=6130 RepID=A0AAD9QJH3_ACRCE|nr:hypothetical protein P5673_014129 [Acropora cervicornis]
MQAEMKSEKNQQRDSVKEQEYRLGKCLVEAHSHAQVLNFLMLPMKGKGMLDVLLCITSTLTLQSKAIAGMNVWQSRLPSLIMY